MSDAALALVQRLYHRYSEGSIDEFFAVIDPAFTLTSCGPPSLFATAGIWRGAEGLRAYLTFDQWVAFKVWGVLVISMIFAASQAPILMKHGKDEPNE